MACLPVDIKCKAKEEIAGFLADGLENIAKAIMEGLSQMVTALSTFWVETPTVNLAGNEGGSSPVVAAVNNELMVWTLSLAVLAVIIGGTRMIWEQRGAPLKDLLRSLITLTLVTGLGVSVISILVIAADAFSVAIINESTDGKSFAESMTMLTAMGETGTAVFILIILGLVGLIASIVQIVLMVVRSGMLVILAGILPTTAAFTNTEMGKQWFQKAIGWTIAFILYKPAAAIVYSVAFLLMSSDGGLIGSITGFTLMIVALFALPALMRFVTPMVGAVASGAGGGAAGAAVGALATGAVSMGRMGSGKGNAAPTPSSSKGNAGQSGSSAQGSSGTPGSRGGGGQPTPGSTGSAGSNGSTGTGTPGTSGAGAGAGKSGTAGTAGAAGTAGTSGAAAGAGKAAAGSGAVAGPAGMAAGAAVQVASKTSEAVKTAAQDSTGEGPSGSN
ncbi:hypothetical protein [Arthrobacter sunyaminii]|uniref:hypothetical protein n=1 Tax=Arthrobacter sunyaminii TaxID=2816859 RepID=UPI003556FFB2